jgi:hypothetical protein
MKNKKVSKTYYSINNIIIRRESKRLNLNNFKLHKMNLFNTVLNIFLKIIHNKII